MLRKWMGNIKMVCAGEKKSATVWLSSPSFLFQVTILFSMVSISADYLTRMKSISDT